MKSCPITVSQSFIKKPLTPFHSPVQILSAPKNREDTALLKRAFD